MVRRWVPEDCQNRQSGEPPLVLWGRQAPPGPRGLPPPPPHPAPPSAAPRGISFKGEPDAGTSHECSLAQWTKHCWHFQEWTEHCVHFGGLQDSWTDTSVLSHATRLIAQPPSVPAPQHPTPRPHPFPWLPALPQSKLLSSHSKWPWEVNT